MRASEIIKESKVESSWITDLSYNRNNKILTMLLSNGKKFSISGVSRRIFDDWRKYPSKGKFFHNSIKNNYNIIRIR